MFTFKPYMLTWNTACDTNIDLSFFSHFIVLLHLDHFGTNLYRMTLTFLIQGLRIDWTPVMSATLCRHKRKLSKHISRIIILTIYAEISE